MTSIPSVYLGIYPTIALFTWFTEHIQIDVQTRVTNSILSRHSSRIDHHALRTKTQNHKIHHINNMSKKTTTKPGKPVPKFDKKTRTINYQLRLGLQVETRPYSKDYNELTVDYCVPNGQVKKVEDMVITHLDNEELWTQTGSLSVGKFTARIHHYKSLKKNFKVTFHSKGWIRAQLKAAKKKIIDERKKQVAENKKIAVAKKKEKSKLIEATKKKAGKSKGKSTSKVYKSSKTIKRPPHKVFTIDPRGAPSLGLQIEENDDEMVEVTQCHTGSQVKGVKGFIMYKIENFQVFKSINSVENLLQKLLKSNTTTKFKITFVKSEFINDLMEWDLQQDKKKQAKSKSSSSSSSTSSSSSSNGKSAPKSKTGKKRKASEMMSPGQHRAALLKKEKECKKLKKENAALKQQLVSLRHFNNTLQSQNNELMEDGSDDEGMAV